MKKPPMERRIIPSLWLSAQDLVYADPMNLLIFLDNHDTSRFYRNDEDTKIWTATNKHLLFCLPPGYPSDLLWDRDIDGGGDKANGDGLLVVTIPADGKAICTIVSKRQSHHRQREAFDYMQKLLQWRKGNEAIAKGTLKHFAPNKGIYAYERKYGNKSVYCIHEWKRQGTEYWFNSL